MFIISFAITCSFFIISFLVRTGAQGTSLAVSTFNQSSDVLFLSSVCIKFSLSLIFSCLSSAVKNLGSLNHSFLLKASQRLSHSLSDWTATEINPSLVS